MRAIECAARRAPDLPQAARTSLAEVAFLLCVGAAAAAGIVGGYVCNMQRRSQCAILAAEFSHVLRRVSSAYD